MKELVEISCAARALLRAGKPGWLATVVRVRGSAYRQPGARLLFTSGQALAGSVSGGCLENDVVRRGQWLCEDRPQVITYDSRAEEEDIGRPGTGCDGAIDLLFERVDEALIAFLEHCLKNEQRGVVVTIARSSSFAAPVGSRLFVDAEGSLSAPASMLDSILQAELLQSARAALEASASHYHESPSGSQALVELIEPPPQLFVFGAGPDAECLVRQAQAIGFNVCVCTREPRFVIQNRLSDVAEIRFIHSANAFEAIETSATPLAVVMTHSYQNDREALATLLASKARYIGVLGPARRCARLLVDIARNMPVSRLGNPKRVYGPAGLHLGGSSPAEVALSILAEAQAVLHAASAVSLRDRGQPIHAALVQTRPTPNLHFAAEGS